MNVRLTTIVSCAVASSLLVPAAKAQPSSHVTAHLEIDVPEADCPTAAEVAAGAEQRLERQVFVDRTRAQVRVTGRLERRDEQSWQVELRMETHDGRVLGTREIVSEHPRCDALRDSLPLVVALLVDVPLEHVRLVLPAPSAPPPDAAPAPAATFRSSGAAAPPPEPVDRWRWQIAAAMRGAVGRFPGVALGPAVHAGATAPLGLRLELGIEAAWSVDAGAGPGARFVDLLGRIGACPVLPVGRARLAACAGLGAGWLWARPRELDYGQTQRRPYAEARVWLEGEVGLSSALFARLGVGLAAPLTRHRFHFSLPDGGERRVHEIAEITPFAEISVGWEAP